MQNNQRRTVLMVDIGGTNVKLKSSADGPMRQFASGRSLTPDAMIAQVRDLTSDWHFDVASIGFPAPVRDAQVAVEPGNLGTGWLGYDFAAGLRCPVRVINDAAMQAVAAYRGGRMLFIGLGTGTGGALTVDGITIPMELGALRLTRTTTVADRLSKAALENWGAQRWCATVVELVALLDRVFYPDEFVIGGGNEIYLSSLPSRCRLFHNEDAYLGAVRLWGDGEVIAVADGSSWRLQRGT